MLIIVQVFPAVVNLLMQKHWLIGTTVLSKLTITLCVLMVCMTSIQNY